MKGLTRLRRGAGCLLAAAAVLAAAPHPAAAAPGLDTVVQDDLTLLHGTPDQVAASMQRLKVLGVDRVRLTANWSVLTRETDAEQAPVFDQSDPAAYEQQRWNDLDDAVGAANAAGLDVLIDIGFWAPHWATTDPPGPRARTNVDPTAYAAFVQAVLRRYSGTFVVPAESGPAPAPSSDDQFLGSMFGGGSSPAPAPVAMHPAPLPKVTQFALWNEPNQPSLLLPQWHGRNPASPKLYRAMLAAAVPAGRAVRPDAELLVGNTSSAAGKVGSGAVAPLEFIRDLACVDRRLRPLKTPQCADFKPIDGDGWAHHPYTRNRRPDQPARLDRPDDVGIAELPKLAALLDALARQGRISPRMTRIHITEFGYETTPVPGRPTLSQPTQARFLTWAEQLAAQVPDVVGWAQFLLKDQPGAAVKVSDSPNRMFGQYGTGLETADGTPKVASQTFVAGLFARATSTRQAALWVRLRLGAGNVSVQIQKATPQGWKAVATRAAPGAPAPTHFLLGGHDQVTRLAAWRRGDHFRVVATLPDGSAATGISVPVISSVAKAPRLGTIIAPDSSR